MSEGLDADQLEVLAQIMRKLEVGWLTTGSGIEASRVEFTDAEGTPVCTMQSSEGSWSLRLKQPVFQPKSQYAPPISWGGISTVTATYDDGSPIL